MIKPLQLNRLIAAPLLAILLSANAQLAYAGYDEGVAAYERKDYATALKEWRPLADQGSVDAQYSLARMYANGEGVPKDDQQAVRWYRKAAEQGDDAAQSNLGNMYANGHGVPKDDQLAAQWYRKAADQGYAGAQFNLGLMYKNGRGVAKDDEQAYFWWLLASAQGIENAKKNRDIIERQISQVQRAAAQTRARNWVPKKN